MAMKKISRGEGKSPKSKIRVAHSPVTGYPTAVREVAYARNGRQAGRQICLAQSGYSRKVYPVGSSR